MSQTKKNIIDSILNIASRFKLTDEFRIVPSWIDYKIDAVRAELIVKEFAQTGNIDHTWLSSPMKVTLHNTNFADDPTVSCPFTVSKCTIPQTISLKSPNDINHDLGIFRVTSMCGNTQYFFNRMFMWTYTPKSHTNSLFRYYDRYNTELFINKANIDSLLIVPILLHPEDGKLNNSTPVASGSLVNGTVYYITGSQIIYNGAVKAAGTTFTANATTTFTGQGTVYLNSVVEDVLDTDPYPASAEMIRQIEIEILTKEFNIEKGQLTDVRNDSVDDANKTVEV